MTTEAPRPEWLRKVPDRSLARRRIGLVLGAGGATGAAFHAGTLLALQHDARWDPNSADVIVGSSAGSIVAGLLRAGLTTDDLSAWGTTAAPRSDGRVSRDLLDNMGSTRNALVPSRPRLPFRSLAILGSLAHSPRPSIAGIVTSLMPTGWVDAPTNLERIGRLLEAWPERDLWVTAVDTSSARRVVFGKDDTSLTPGRAIAASCAIPGIYRPITIGGRRYIDGGAHSPTNADVMLDAPVDTVIISSPMSARPGASTRRPDHLMRALLHRRLQREADRLTRAGLDVHVFEPDRATIDSMGINALDSSRTGRVVRDAFLAAGDQIADSVTLREILSESQAVDTWRTT